VDWKLELIVVPVSDIDRAKAFYIEKTGFELLVDFSGADDFRVVQLNPPGSACAIALMRDTDGGAGSLKGLHLIVPDIDGARAELIGRGAAVSDVFHFDDGRQRPGPDAQRASYNSFFSFEDPDGNTWLVQEVHRGEPA
jgi:catechol 2,3-dioxygenase-like lactoylglutathione lyase family enzyme